MSHFIGLVITTPDYDGTLSDSLSKYDENREVDPYVASEVTVVDMFDAVSWYSMTKDEANTLKQKVVEAIKSAKGDEFYTYEKYCEEFKGWIHDQSEDYLRACWVNHILYDKELYYEDFNEYLATKTDIAVRFPDVYKQNGEDWDKNQYKLSNDGVWEEWSTYNPDSKWDWYVSDSNSRWDGFLLTKHGERVNSCRFSELDLDTPNEENTYSFHLADDFLPFCIVVDGEWYEKAEMGWWGITIGDKPKEEWEAKVKELLSTLPPDSMVNAVDFHI